MENIDIIIYINKSTMSAKWIKSRRAFGWAQRAQLMDPKGYSPPQELEKARKAGYFSSVE